MTENRRFESLLKDIRSILKRNQELEKLKGEKFNLFMILDKQRDEVRTHSAFISELLNPHGSHGMGSVFLGLFFDMLIQQKYLSEYSNECLDKTLINVEKYVGNILDINSRLDIYISNKEIHICIENKIDARDQSLQLERYKNFLDRDKSKKQLLIYLSLSGKEYKKSEFEKDSEYICLSYKDDILNWLKECQKETADYPILRESIKQYIILIKSLTHQLTSNEMQAEIQKMILSDIESAEIIKNNYDKAIRDIAGELKAQIAKKLAPSFIEKGYTIEFGEWRQFSSLFISSPQKEFKIGVESFNGQGHRNGEFFIGAFDSDKKNKDLRYINGPWIDGTIEQIWNRETLFQKLQNFANGNEQSREAIVNDIVNKIEDYVKKYWESAIPVN